MVPKLYIVNHCHCHFFISYSRDVVPFTRSDQVNNPEVLVCTSHKQFLDELRLLLFMTEELEALTGACSLDDEDCVEVAPTNRYYDLDAIDLSSVDLSQGSGRGSGSDDNMDDDFEVPEVNEDMACKPGTIPY